MHVDTYIHTSTYMYVILNTLYLSTYLHWQMPEVRPGRQRKKVLYFSSLLWIGADPVGVFSDPHVIHLLFYTPQTGNGHPLIAKPHSCGIIKKTHVILVWVALLFLVRLIALSFPEWVCWDEVLVSRYQRQFVAICDLAVRWHAIGKVSLDRIVTCSDHTSCAEVPTGHRDAITSSSAPLVLHTRLSYHAIAAC